MKIKIGCCDKCGRMAKLPNDFDVTPDDDEQVTVSRCATIYETDDGEETCEGTVYFVGYMDLWDRA